MQEKPDSTWYDLTALQRDILEALAGLEQEMTDVHGLAIRDELETRYDDLINHSTVYQRVDELEAAGLVEVDRKTANLRRNSYKLTTAGRDLLQKHTRAVGGAVDLEVGMSVPADGEEQS